MAFDSVIVSFTTKTDKVDLVQAAHMNTVQSELVTIETILGAGVKGDRTNLKTRLNNALDADGSLLSGSAFPSPALASQPYFRTDLDVFYIRNAANTAWLVQGVSLSNVIFSWLGYDANTGSAGNDGLYVGTSRIPTAGSITTNMFYVRQGSNNTSYGVLFPTFRWTKISGVNTLNFHARTWQRDEGETGGGHGYTLQADCGGQQGTLTVSSTIETPSWRTAFTVDVSGLVNGTTYDIVINSKANDLSYSFNQYISGLIVMGS